MKDILKDYFRIYIKTNFNPEYTLMVQYLSLKLKMCSLKSTVLISILKISLLLHNSLIQ